MALASLVSWTRVDPHGRSSLSTARKTIFVYAPTWVYDGVALYWQNQPVMGGQVQRGTSQEAQVSAPWVTVAVPSYNQGRFLDATLRSIFAQSVPIEVMLADGGSTDETQDVIAQWRHQLAWWRSAPDEGQAASINEAIGRGRAPFVCWMNSDDLFLPYGLAALVQTLQANPGTAVAYGGCRLIDENGDLIGLCRGREVSERSLSRRTVVPQPASLIRREAWEKVSGLKENLHLSLDYDLWWRLYRSGAKFTRIGMDVAAARFHANAKSFTKPREMYEEAKSVVHEHYGSVPVSWRIKEPFSVQARKQGTVFESVMRAYRFWSMQFLQAGRAAGEEHSIHTYFKSEEVPRSELASYEVELDDWNSDGSRDGEQYGGTLGSQSANLLMKGYYCRRTITPRLSRPVKWNVF